MILLPVFYEVGNTATVGSNTTCLENICRCSTWSIRQRKTTWQRPCRCSSWRTPTCSSCWRPSGTRACPGSAARTCCCRRRRWCASASCSRCTRWPTSRRRTPPPAARCASRSSSSCVTPPATLCSSVSYINALKRKLNSFTSRAHCPGFLSWQYLALWFYEWHWWSIMKTSGNLLTAKLYNYINQNNTYSGIYVTILYYLAIIEQPVYPGEAACESLGIYSIHFYT